VEKIGAKNAPFNALPFSSKVLRPYAGRSPGSWLLFVIASHVDIRHSEITLYNRHIQLRVSFRFYGIPFSSRPRAIGTPAIEYWKEQKL